MHARDARKPDARNYQYTEEMELARFAA